jgi:hypothetical protein
VKRSTNEDILQVVENVQEEEIVEEEEQEETKTRRKKKVLNLKSGF